MAMVTAVVKAMAMAKAMAPTEVIPTAVEMPLATTTTVVMPIEFIQ